MSLAHALPHPSSLSSAASWRSPDLGTRHEIDLPQGRLVYHDAGSGEPIVLSHGWLANANLWRKVVALLAPRFRCITPDLPLGSHTLPMPAGTSLDPNAVGSILGALVEGLGLDGVTLVGNDSGGAYSQVAAAAHLRRVRRIILNACETPYDRFPPAAFENLCEAARMPDGLQTLLAPLRDAEFRLGPVAFGRLIKHGVEERVSDTWALPILEDRDIASDASRVMSSASQAYVATAGARLIAEFDGRVSFLWPEDDVYFSLESVRRYAAELKNAEVVMIADSFAFTPEDQPAQLAAWIEDQMKKG